MSTANNIIDYARENLKIDPSATIWTDVQLLRWFNEAVKKLRSKADWEDSESSATITLVDGTAAYTAEADYNRLIQNSVIFTTSGGDESEVEIKELYEIQDTYMDLTTTGDAPLYIYETANTLGFYPVPNAVAATGTLAYRYYAYPTAYSLTTTVTGLEAEYPDILEDYIEYKAWKQLPGREANSNLSLQRWDDGIIELKMDKLRKAGPIIEFRNLKKEEKSI